MKDETIEALSSVGTFALATCLLGPFSLFFVPDIVRNVKNAKENRLTREAQARIDHAVAIEAAKVQADIAADQQARINAERTAQREAKRLERERIALENRIAETRQAIKFELAYRESQRNNTQAWLDNYYAERQRRHLRMRNIYPLKPDPKYVARCATAEDIVEYRKQRDGSK